MPDLTQFRTYVDIFSGVPLEIGTNHTILFETARDQKAYFDSKKTVSGTFTNISYQRHASGVMRLEAQMSLLGTANYLRFCNPTFENREFYSFIVDIAYVNNSTVEITYVIDVLQTWMFEYNVNPCFVDREHAETDNVGDNRVNEGLDTGPFVQAGLEEINHWGTELTDTSFFVVASQGPNGEDGVNYDYKVYAALYCQNCPTIQDLNTLLQGYMAGPTMSLEPIISITQYPSSFYNSTTQKTAPVVSTLTKDQTIGLGPFVMTDPVGYTIPTGVNYYLDPEFTQYVASTAEVQYGKMFESGVVVFSTPDIWYVPTGTHYYSDPQLTQEVGVVSNYELADTYENGVLTFNRTVGIVVTPYYVSSAYCQIAKFFCDISECVLGGYSWYTPKNNKLYTYPYNYMVLESPEGSSTTLRFEDFKNHNIHQFMSALTVFPYAESMCAPMDYETVDMSYNIQNAMFSKSYPTVGLATDAFLAWWAQNKYAMSLVKAGVDAADAVVGAVAEGAATTKEVYNDDSGWASTGNAFADKALKMFMSPIIGLGAGFNKLAGSVSAGASAAKEAVSNANAGTIAGAIAEGWSIANAPETIAREIMAMYAHKAIPDSVVTKANAPSLLTYMGMLNYRIYYMKIRPEYAEMIDNYFSCYGYAVKRVKRPNIKSRTEWNYVKTTGCTISGNVPGDVEAAICSAYDKGLTFWHNPNHMYRYDLDNPINREVTGNG